MSHSAEDEPNASRRRATVREVLHRACRGDGAAEVDLSSLVYDDLRKLAAGLLRRERPDHTLQATALVHEAWMRLADEVQLAAPDAEQARRRFLRHAVQAMRRILIDHARAHLREKRGGDRQRVGWSDLATTEGPDAPELLDLDEALTDLAQSKPRAAKIAELRIFGGLSTTEAAEVVGVSLATAKVDWALGRALLTSRVRGMGAD